jgi:hypothetical protein
MDFTIAGDRVYIIDGSFRTDPVKQMPLAGGALTELGGHQCQYVLGVDADTLYAHCSGLVGISLKNPTSMPQVLLAGTVYNPVLAGKYIYFYDTDDMYDGPFMIQRVELADHKLETLATVEGRFRIGGPIVGSDASICSSIPAQACRPSRAPCCGSSYRSQRRVRASATSRASASLPGLWGGRRSAWLASNRRDSAVRSTSRNRPSHPGPGSRVSL